MAGFLVLKKYNNSNVSFRTRIGSHTQPVIELHTTKETISAGWRRKKEGKGERKK